ncbi:MAG: WYL domain-containing protein [Lachnospiraceae bacterium]|nr:WYL domain-containing protein [Lachnospiraceae bacterium]
MINKSSRTLDFYVRLCEGKAINKKAEAQRFGVDERSIQRDIDDIRAFLSDRAESAVDVRTIVYDRSKKGFIMTGCEGSLMTNEEIFAVSKILLESRAFTKQEVTTVLDKMIAGCVPLRNMKLVTELIANEKFHYVEPRHGSSVKEKLWMLGEEIKKCHLLEIAYEKQVASRELVKRTVEPVGLVFSEFYFYLNAFIVEKDERGRFVHKYDYPAIFRLDRIRSIQELDATFCIPGADRFQEGEFRKRVQFMFPGPLTSIQFRYTGQSPEAVLDRLPTARVLRQEPEGAFVVEAEVYGKGILMWLLSQGDRVEVLRPKALREELKGMLQRMLALYV